jgi:hypothetical protein
VPASRRTLPRILGTIGAVVVAVSTFVSWYEFDVVLRVGRAVQVFRVPVDLWGPSPVAGLVLLAASVGAVALLNLPVSVPPRQAAVAAAVVGAGITVFAVVRLFDVPDLGFSTLAPPKTAVRARTDLDGGPFLALGGGLILTAGAVGALLAAPARPRAAGRARRRPRRAGRGTRGRPTPTRGGADR